MDYSIEPPPEPVYSSKRHDVYYMDWITFQVEDTLFKVPKHHFARDSEIFHNMLALPQYPDISSEGLTDTTPLKLYGVSKTDFQRLLKVFYPLEINPKFDLSRDEWVSVLSLATMWRFLAVRALAIIKLTEMKLDPVDRVGLGKMYEVPQWLRSGYQELAARDTIMSNEEAQRIGYPTAIRICQMREAGRRNYGSYSSSGIDVDQYFGEELKEVELAYNEYRVGRE